MEFYNKVKSQQDQPDQGELKVSVFTEDGTRPVENALVRISYTGESGQTVEEVRTDSSGQTPTLELKHHLWNIVWNQWKNSLMRSIRFRCRRKDLKIQKLQEHRYYQRGGAAIDKMAFQAEASFEDL